MSDQFDAYFAIFEQAGKPLSETDKLNACRQWVSLNDTEPLSWQDAAISDARAVCSAASGPTFVPLPVTHLREKRWKRVAAAAPALGTHQMCATCCDTGHVLIDATWSACTCAAGSHAPAMGWLGKRVHPEDYAAVFG